MICQVFSVIFCNFLHAVFYDRAQNNSKQPKSSQKTASIPHLNHTETDAFVEKNTPDPRGAASQDNLELFENVVST